VRDDTRRLSGDGIENGSSSNRRPIRSALLPRVGRGSAVFTTVWIPFESLTAVRLGWVRFQYRPAGKHWTFKGGVCDQLSMIY
jgi:hypothetical protein